MAIVSRQPRVTLPIGNPTTNKPESRAKACAPLSPRIFHQSTRRKSKRTLNTCQTTISVRLTVPDIVEHVKLFRSFLENISNAKEFPLAPAVKWKIVPEQGHTVMTFCTWERERLLAKVAGSFSVVPLNILSADIFPRDDNAVLGVFRVCDTKAQPVSNPRDFELVEQTLQSSTRGRELRFCPR